MTHKKQLKSLTKNICLNVGLLNVKWLKIFPLNNFILNKFYETEALSFIYKYICDMLVYHSFTCVSWIMDANNFAGCSIKIELYAAILFFHPHICSMEMHLTPFFNINIVVALDMADIYADFFHPFNHIPLTSILKLVKSSHYYLSESSVIFVKKNTLMKFKIKL